VLAGWGDNLSAPSVLQCRDIGVAGTIELDIDSLEHFRKIGVNLRIPEAHDPISLSFKPELSFAIALGVGIIVVMSTVKFNNEPLGRTEEVNHIGTDRRLPSEVRASYRDFLESAPERALVRRCVGSQSLCGCASDRI